MSITVYGIPNCDTIKKARKFLETNQIDYQFHDYRKQGIDAQLVQSFFDQFGWQNVLNKRGTTYRQLSDEQKQNLDEAMALELLVEMPAMIKRPILISDSQQLIGFKADEYQTLQA
ncbi:MAG: ArsC family reductase [Vibrio sp.]